MSRKRRRPPTEAEIRTWRAFEVPVWLLDRMTKEEALAWWMAQKRRLHNTFHGGLNALQQDYCRGRRARFQGGLCPTRTLAAAVVTETPLAEEVGYQRRAREDGSIHIDTGSFYYRMPTPRDARLAVPASSGSAKDNTGAEANGGREGEGE